MITACGGGGGGESATDKITISATPQTLAVATTTTSAAPSATIDVSASSVPSGGLYIETSGTSHGIASAALGSSGSDAIVTLAFQSPSALGAGVFVDTVTIKVCLDSTCTQQVSNSPLKVGVTYTVTVGDPATATPTLSALTPASVVAGGAAFTLVVAGGQFAPTSTLQWNGQDRATTYVSPTSLSAQITATDIASIQTAAVTVSNASTGGGVSAALGFSVVAPTPVIASISPASVGAGGSAFTLTVTGSGFDGNARISWNGNPRTTNHVTSTQLTTQIGASDIAATGAFPITVTNLDNASVASNAVNVNVVDAALALTKVSPGAVVAGGRAFVETVVGTGFNTSSTVQWNGSPRATTFVSTTELLAQITAADIASGSSAAVTVVNAGTNPGTSTAATVTLATASIDAVAFQINAQHNGAINFANIVAPSAFPSAATWTTTLDGTPSYALIAGGRVFATVALSGGGSELVALNAATGAKLWGPIALPYAANATYENGRVFVLSASIGTSGMLSAYDAASGTPLWSTALTSQYSFTGPPTAANGFVYAGAAGFGGTLYAVDESNGALAWTASVENGDNSSPTVTADGVYVSYPCQTYDFRPLTGELVWNNSTGCEGGGGATGLAANGVVYSPNGASGFSGMSFDAESGTYLSAYTASAPPAIGATTGYFLQGGTLRAIANTSGVIQWSFAGDGTLVTAPILVNGYVFAAANSGNLYALDATTGSTVWQVDLGGAMSTNTQLQASGLSAGDGLLVVPIGNKLIAYTLSTNP